MVARGRTCATPTASKNPRSIGARDRMGDSQQLTPAEPGASDATPATPTPPPSGGGRSLRSIALIVAVATGLSKVVGLLRQQVIAAAFGVGAAYDEIGRAHV